MPLLSFLSRSKPRPTAITAETHLRPPIYHGPMSLIYPVSDVPDTVMKLYGQLTRLSHYGSLGPKRLRRSSHYQPLVLGKDSVADYASFQRESQALEAIKHPQVIRILSQGTFVQKGLSIPYTILERVRGRDFGKLLEQRSQASLGLIAPIILGAARGLAYAHQQGYVHKDVKPPNILLDSSNNPIVSDFGCAVRIADRRGDDEWVRGSPRYMSPEQAQGLPLDQRSDVYSLGMTLFEAIIGRSPHDETVETAELLKKKVTEETPDPASFIPGMQERLAALIRRATARDKEQRYSSMDDLIGDLLDAQRLA